MEGNHQDSSHRLRRTSDRLHQRAVWMRRGPTPAERKLWTHLRNSNLNGFKFRRQFPLGNYVLDFYCAECRLVVELDGSVHVKVLEHDRVRTQWLSERGLKVLRFDNSIVLSTIDSVLEEILCECEMRSSRELRPSPPPSPRRGEGEQQ